MLLSELIQPDLIKIGLEATDKWEAIEELVDHLISNHELRINDRSDVIEAVENRERSLSTGLEHGLAVPHGAVEVVSEIIACIGIAKNGIPFESMDGKPAQLVVLLIIPKGAFSRHVRTLAGIARLANNPAFRQRILAAEDPDEVLEVIFEMEANEEAAQFEEDE